MEGHGSQAGAEQGHEPLGTDQCDGHAHVAGTRHQDAQKRQVRHMRCS